jgi:IS1 family transposase
MNKLSIEKQILVLSSLVEGNSIRSIERISGVHRDTIMRLLISAGIRALDLHDRFMINLKCNLLQVDEIWTYVGKKQKTLNLDERYYEKTEYGDQYVFVALDAETKLVPVYRVGKRNREVTNSFMSEVRTRIDTRFQLSSDSFQPYLNAVKRAFNEEDIDYAQLHKSYGEEFAGEKRYSPAKITGIKLIPLIGTPKRENISTSFIERQNLTMRMQMRRFTRLTNAFSKKLENLKHAVALHFFYYNFMRIHKTLRVTPCMQAGLTNTIWTWERFLGIEEEQRRKVA